MVILGLSLLLSQGSPLLSSPLPSEPRPSTKRVSAARKAAPEKITAEDFSRLPLQRQLSLFGKLPLHQQIKVWITGLVGLTTDAVHIYVGFFCLLITMILVGGRPDDFRKLIPGILASLLMEGFDLYFDFDRLGLFRFLASAHDLLNTNLIPLLFLCFLRATLTSQRSRVSPLRD